MALRFLPFIPVLALTACYTYQPLPTTEPQIGTRVSVQLTEEGSRNLWGEIGPNALHVEGDVLSVDSSALGLSVRQIENQRGIASDWNGERVMFPRTALAGVQQRRLSIGGTGLMGGVALAAMLALYQVLGGGGTSEGNSGGGGGAPR